MISLKNLIKLLSLCLALILSCNLTITTQQLHAAKKPCNGKNSSFDPTKIKSEEIARHFCTDCNQYHSIRIFSIPENEELENNDTQEEISENEKTFKTERIFATVTRSEEVTEPLPTNLFIARNGKRHSVEYLDQSL